MTTENEKQRWNDAIVRYERTITEYESEIAQIRKWWDSEHRVEPANGRIAHLENEIAVQRVCLEAAIEKRDSL